MIYIHHSNQLEELAAQLTQDLQSPSRSIMQPEIISTPSICINQWLTIQIAKSQGISANIKWLPPSSLIWHCFRSALKNVPDFNGFSSEVLSWRILRVLKDDLFVRRFSDLQNYLSESSELRKWKLACKLGLLFEQYLVFRPDWIIDWEREVNLDWQGRLWLEIIKGGDDKHWLVLRERFIKELNKNPNISKNLPERIFLFSVMGLSSLFLDFVSKLSDQIDIHIYHLNFSSEYWADIPSKKQQAKLFACYDDYEIEDFNDLNSLLSSMGRFGREHFRNLLQLESVDYEKYAIPPRISILNRIQADIVELRSDSEIGLDSERLSELDRSIQVHVCHSKMREIQVLHDQLLNLFDSDEGMTSADVRVYIPKLSNYIPFIYSVFGAADGNRHIPWCVAENSINENGSLSTAFIRLLEILNGRLDVNKIYSLLDFSLLRKKFGLSKSDLDQIKRWIYSLRIHWGSDSEELTKLDITMSDVHTWRGATDRMLLGFAIGDLDCNFRDNIPFSPGDSSSAKVLGKWRSFIEKLISARSDLSDFKSLSSWVTTLNKLLEDFFVHGKENEENVFQIRRQIAKLAQDSAVANFEEKVSIQIVRNALEASVGEISKKNFMSGAITFSNLSYGRCIPSKITCLVGMNDEDFPDRDVSLGIDKMLKERKAGDRSRRDEDMHSFLEAIMSTRETLYISYTGANMRDTSIVNPSLVVKEFLIQIDTVSGESDYSKKITTEHPMQPFSYRYFEAKSELFSYCQEMQPVSKKNKKKKNKVFNISLIGGLKQDLTINQLIKFLFNPVRYLFQERLGIDLKSDLSLPSNREIMKLDPLERRKISNVALTAQLDQTECEVFISKCRLQGIAPHGSPGDLALKYEWNKAQSMSKRVEALNKGMDFSKCDLSISLRGFNLSAHIDNLTNLGQILCFPGGLNSSAVSEAWCKHLFLNLNPSHVDESTYIVLPESVLVLPPINNPDYLLHEILDIYERGNTYPIAFFPRSAWTFINNKSSPLAKAYETWLGSEHTIGQNECADPYFNLAFGDCLESALDEEFINLSQILLGQPKELLAEID